MSQRWGTANAAQIAHRHLVRGRAMMVLSAAGFAAMALLVKLVPPAISSHEKVFFRSFVGLALLVGWMVVRRSWPARPRNVRGLAWRGMLGAAALLLFFYCIDKTSLTKAILYSYTYPIFAALFAWWELGERPRRAGLVALAVAVGGTVLTLDMHGLRPQVSTGEVAGLLSGVLSGAAVSSIRKLRQTESSVWIVMAFLGVSSLAALPFMAGRFVWPGAGALTLLIAVGLVAMVAQIWMTRAYRYLSAVEGSVLSLSAVPISALLGWVALGESLSPRFWVGAALVLGATALLCAQTPGASAPPAADPTGAA